MFGVNCGFNKIEFIVTTLSPHGLEHLTVHSLLDYDNRSWRLDLLQQIFNNIDIQQIQNIHILNSNEVDARTWKLTTSGNYMISSTYLHIDDSLFNDANVKIEGNWKQIWSLPIQLKINHLIWRIQRDCLSSRVRLQSKGVQFPSTCHSCHNNLEYNWHIFFGCENIVSIWVVAGFWMEIQPLAHQAKGISRLIFNIIKTLHHDDCSK